MSAGIRLTRSRIVVLVLVAGVFAFQGVRLARAEDDVLDEVKRRSEVAAQKLEAEMRETLLEAQRFSAKQPDKAEELLKGALATLDADTDLPEARRDLLKRVIKDRIRVLHLAGEKVTQKASESAARETAKETRQSITDKRATEAEDPARRAKAMQDAVRETIEGSKRVRRDAEKRTAAANLEVARSATPAAGDVEFPDAKKWKDLTDKRKKDNLTAAERAILKALDTPITVDFKKSRIQDVIDTLATELGVTIAVDKATLEKRDITYDTEITAGFKRPVTARTVLRKIFGDLGLTYIVRDETIELLTPEMAKDMMVVKAYPIGDLVGNNNVLFGPDINRLQEIDFANQIITMIKQSIEPGSWDENNGAKIVYEPNTRSLVIKQSALVHSMLGKSLR